MSGHPRRPQEPPGSKPERSAGNRSGFAKLPNALVELGYLAHLRPQALKVYLALLLATRTKTGTCFPSGPTITRWSGVAKPSGELTYLERHGLIQRDWIQIGGKPRRPYRVQDPHMLPDVRQSCAVCMLAGRRVTCLNRDPETGRILGRRQVAALAVPRTARPAVPRTTHMLAEMGTTSQREADERIGIRRGRDLGERDGGLRSASPRDAATLRPPGREATPGGDADSDLWAKNNAGIRALRAVIEGHGRPPAPSEGGDFEVGHPGGNRGQLVAGRPAREPPVVTPGPVPCEAATDPDRRGVATGSGSAPGCPPGPAVSSDGREGNAAELLFEQDADFLPEVELLRARAKAATAKAREEEKPQAGPEEVSL